MSEENVEIVRRAFEEFHQRGWEGLIDTIWSPEMVWDMRPSGIPGLGVYRGSEEVRSFFADEWFSTFPFEEWEQDLKEVIDCGDDRVVAVAHQRGRGAASSVNVDLEYTQVITLREGKMVHVETHLDRDKALEAAGCSERPT
jgi:ketosteroid isomerase-like protein